jgi:hypothetical protein
MFQIDLTFYYVKVFDFSGERGIRTPGGVTLNGFQDRRIRPLCHLSGANVRLGIYSKNKKVYFFKNNFKGKNVSCESTFDIMLILFDTWINKKKTILFCLVLDKIKKTAQRS